MTPKYVYLMEIEDGTWRCSLTDDIRSWPVLIKNIYKMEIDWRLLKNE